ncbi:hypothetical protein OG401_22260 [Kitasatospora purpeofusca]|uniref:hypothetical protein n=1 Tax=Kitasatospora purpeofusca TaxID=67352 RepID=UPI0022506606|nr:hypothetical protein [Kitasatospora purpeofusca]MCX4686992.1 hypothetical protein [Kitasatospora purpeofusca]
MTDGSGGGTWIDEARGPTNTGPGPQHNHFYGAPEPSRPKVARSRVALEQRRLLQGRFVPPPGFGEAQSRLAQPGTTVLLAGPPGSGRRAAAVMLLHAVEGPTASFVELSFSPKEEDGAPPEADDRLLLDLSGIPEEDYPAAQRQLYGYWGRVEQAGARMVAVLPSAGQESLLPELRQLVAEIGRPRELAVLRRHLDGRRVRIGPDDLRADELASPLRRFAMRDVQRFADLVARAQQAAPAAPAAEWIRQALGALSDRAGEVAQRVSALDSGPQRALLLSAAMLEGAPADAVFHHADRLLGLVPHTPDEKPLLERADLAERLKALPSLEVDTRGRIRFAALAYDAAVRTHFWTYLPGLREGFGRWVEDAVRAPHPTLGAQARRLLVERFTEQSLRAADWRSLLRLAGEWAADPRREVEALAVLRLSLDHDRYGAAFRSRIYEWATNPAPPALAKVLARACGEVMARTHPDQALVRLHHLARRAGRSGAVAQEVRETLYELVRQDRRLYLKLLIRFGDGMAALRADTADIRLFQDLVGEPPPTRWVPDEALAVTWAKVLTVARREQWSEGVQRWLTVARTDPQTGERLLDVLIAAAGAQPERFTGLYLTAHEWVADGPRDGRSARAEVASRFWQKIDIAQGIEPGDPAEALRSEERTG